MGAANGPGGPLSGLAYVYRGARLVYVERPGLARYWGVPIVLCLLALVTVGYHVFGMREELANAIWTAPTGEAWWHAIGRGMHTAFQWMTALLALLAATVAVSLSASVVAAPFNDALSEAVEAFHDGRSGPSFSLARMLGDLGRTVGLELVKLTAYLAVVVPLFLMSLLLPVVGPVIYSGCAFVITALYLALDYVDWPASRRGLGVRQRLGLLRSHTGLMLGFGVGVWVMMFVPLLNLFFMPAAVAGGTLLFLELDRASEG